MSEVQYSPIATQASETNPAFAPTPDQVGADTRSGRVVNVIRGHDTGETAGATNRFAEPLRDRHAGTTSLGNSKANLEEAQVRDTPLGNRQARAVHTEGGNAPAINTPMPTTPQRNNPASTTGEAQQQPTAKLNWPSIFDLDQLTPEALACLANLSRPATGARQTPVDTLEREDVLRNLPEEARREFVGQRAAAWNLAEDLPEDLPLDYAARAAIKQQVLHDDIPSYLVAPLANAYLQIKEELGSLSGAHSGNELQTAMRAIRDAMNTALDDAGLVFTPENRHRACKTFWRVVLAPGQLDQARGIAEQLQRAGSPLRALGEGATWYKNEHHRLQTARQPSQAAAHSPRAAAQSPQAAGQSPRAAEQSPRVRRQSQRSGQRRPQMATQPPRVAQRASAAAHPASAAGRGSLKTATDYSLMMCSLAEVLREKTGSCPPVEVNGNVPDETIVTLRNLGVPMPAPRRLGQQKQDAPISEAGLAAIRQQLSEHLRVKGQGDFFHGVSAECIRDVQNNTYIVENNVVSRNQGSVGQAMLQICSSPEGHLNQHLLRNLSMLAYRGAFDCVRETCLNSARPEIALFSEEPVVTDVDQSHRLDRDRIGDVTLESRLVGKVQQVKWRNESGTLETVDLDPDQSHLNQTVRFKLDGATGEPELIDAWIDYAFIPAEGSFRDIDSADETMPELESLNGLYVDS